MPGLNHYSVIDSQRKFKRRFLCSGNRSQEVGISVGISCREENLQRLCDYSIFYIDEKVCAIDRS
jgi:hypothetical protein